MFSSSRKFSVLSTAFRRDSPKGWRGSIRSGRNFSRMGRVRAARQKSTFNLVHVSGAWYNREVLDGMALVVDCLVGSPSGRSFGGSFIEGGG